MPSTNTHHRRNLSSFWPWLRDYEMGRFNLLSWFFLRGMGFIYLAAFVSFGVQAAGLIGSHGILPLGDFIIALRDRFGIERFGRFPMLFWLDGSDFTIQAVCWAGAVFAVLLIFNVLPRVSLIVLYVLYLSLFCAGQVFMTFQWDSLLLEAGFLSFVLAVATVPGVWLLRWLVFRFMLLSGSVKLLSGDATWDNLTALIYHFQTQPLPTPLAWYVHHLPHGVLTAATAATFIIELALPFLIFCGRRARFVAGFGFLLLEFIICLTGNYNFFNLLTMLLCLTLFDDAALQWAMPRRFIHFAQKRVQPVKPRKVVFYAVNTLTAVLVFVSFVEMARVYGMRPPAPLTYIGQSIAPLHIVNSYGLFAVMTTTRPEIIIEGSDDGANWKEYAFRDKPGDVMRPPLWNIPHQPRLDWQMWFAALGTREQNPWFSRFLWQLLKNSPDVTVLLETNPFPEKPPVYVRALIYDYRFSTAEEKAKTGAWWVRRLEGIYFPPAQLRPS